MNDAENQTVWQRIENLGNSPVIRGKVNQEQLTQIKFSFFSLYALKSLVWYWNTYKVCPCGAREQGDFKISHGNKCPTIYALEQPMEEIDAAIDMLEPALKLIEISAGTRK